MSAPNHAAVVKQVYEAGHYDLTTKIGCGRFLEDATWQLQQVDRRWGHLKKRQGQHQWNGHAVDNPLYLSDAAGQSQAVDIIQSAESTDARLQWAPDQPRYSQADWYAPIGPDAFVLPPHSTKLGASLFWLLGGWKFHRSQVIANINWIKFDLGADYIRAMFSCTGVKAWALIGSDPRWPDFGQVVVEASDYCRSIGLKIAWTIVGEAAGAPDPLALCERYANLTRDHRDTIELTECWNEYRLTGGNVATIRDMALVLRAHLGPAALIALDTPHYAMAAPVGEAADPLQAEVTAFYGGSAANCITPQWDRSQPNPRELGPDNPGNEYSHEPRGPNASAGGDTEDPLPLAHDYIQSCLAGYRGYLFHSQAGVWGGHCHPDFPDQNAVANIFEHDNIVNIAAALSSVRAGLVPGVPGGGGGGGTPEMPAKPREQFFREFNDVNTFYAAEVGLKRPGGMVIDTAVPPRADTEAMAAWGYDLMSGKTPEQVKHDICQSDEWKTKHPGETPPF